MAKLDLQKELKHLYQPTSKEFSIVEVPPMNFVMLDGRGDPNTSEEFQGAMTALYGMSFTLKFASKRQLGIDYTVMPSEGLWWTDGALGLNLEDKSKFCWTLMLMQPEQITASMVEQAWKDVQRKRPSPALDRVRFERFAEGWAVQIMYIGPYANEGPTIARMHEFIAQNGYEPAGKHHEIYLGNPRRSAPEKLKTVLRQPIRKVG
jgi:hypothetical protein